ncbi:MAG: DUF3047 domain-containing protein [Desulfofustis sp.]|nr:DUF3047 domain-containing protein [Desulfofustis sp.]
MTGHSMVRSSEGWRRLPGVDIICMRIVTSLFLCCVLLTVAGDGSAEQRVELGNWASAEDGRLPQHWRLLTFPSISAATRYELVYDPFYGRVIEAQSSAGAGGIGRSLSIDPQKYPILNWSWKIANTIIGSSLSLKSGDDFPVRLMISFESESTKRGGLKDKILCYVWAATEPIGSVAANPSHSHIQTFVAISGNERRGDWLEMSRNLVEDYRTAFSEEPGKITGLVLMTDSDDTGSEAHAWYGPIWLGSEVEAAPDSE